jgi:hypothetical protein
MVARRALAPSLRGVGQVGEFRKVPIVVIPPRALRTKPKTPLLLW